MESLKIVDVLPEEFVDYMGRCEDQAIIKKFSGKALLRIVDLEHRICADK